MAIGPCKFFNLFTNTGDYSPGRDGPRGRTVWGFGTCDGGGGLGVVGRPCSNVQILDAFRGGGENVVRTRSCPSPITISRVRSKTPTADKASGFSFTGLALPGVVNIRVYPMVTATGRESDASRVYFKKADRIKWTNPALNRTRHRLWKISELNLEDR